MARFRISSHGRLQDWVAVEKGTSMTRGSTTSSTSGALEGGRPESTATAEADDARGDIRGVYESWRQAPGKRRHELRLPLGGQPGGERRSRAHVGARVLDSPERIYVAGDPRSDAPDDLAGVDVAVGYHSGSHFSAIQALEAEPGSGAISSRFVGMPYDRVDALLDGEVPAANMWGAQTYLVEQQGFRKVARQHLHGGLHVQRATSTRRRREVLQRAQARADGPRSTSPNATSTTT